MSTSAATPAAAASTAAAAATTTPINIAASQNPAHPQHNFSLGQVLGTVALGLAAYQAESQSGPAIFENPQTLAALIQGFSSIWVQPATPTK